MESDAFFNPKWLNKTFTVKKYQDEIDSIMQTAAKDIHTIQSTGGKHTAVMMARYYETLSLEGITGSEGRIEIDELDLAFICFYKLWKQFFGTGKKERTGSAYLMMFRFAIDPHSSFLRYSFPLIIIQDIGPDSKRYPYILLTVVTFFARF